MKYKEEDDLDRYAKMKHEVMDEDELKLSDKFLDYYRSSWKDKDNRGLYDKWEEIDLYWEGDANPPESDIDPGSNTNIIHPNVEGQVALLVDKNIAIEAEPITPSEGPYRDIAKVMMEWCLENNRMKRKLDVHERRRKKFGTGVFRVLFDPDAMDGFGLPDIQPRNIAYVFTDPAITDIYEIQKGRFIVETMRRSIDWALDCEKYDEDRVKAISPGYDPIEEEAIFGEDEGETDSISRDTYLHVWVWTKKKGKVRLVEMSGCGVILWDSNKDYEGDDFLPTGKYPYFFTPDFFREGTIHGKSTAELLVNTQNLIDDLDDQIRMNARLTGNPQKLIDVGTGIDVDKWTNESGLNIPTTDINGAKFLEPPGMPMYIIDRRKYAMEYEGQRITRFSDQMTGQKASGVDTATEALAIQQAGAAGIDHSKSLLEETLSEVFEYCLDLMVDNYEDEYGFSLPDKKGEFLWFRASSLNEIPTMMPASMMYVDAFAKRNQGAELPKWMEVENEKKRAAFRIRVDVGAGLPKNKAFIYKLITENAPRPILTPEEARKLLRDYGGLPISEQPPMNAQQPIQPGQGGGMGPIPPPPVVPTSKEIGTDIEGLNQNNNPSISDVKGGVAGANPPGEIGF